MYGLFMGTTLTLARPISSLLFHHDYPGGGRGFDGFITDVLSSVLAGVALALIAGSAAALWKRARHRGGPRGPAAEHPGPLPE